MSIKIKSETDSKANFKYQSQFTVALRIANILKDTANRIFAVIYTKITTLVLLDFNQVPFNRMHLLR